MVGILVGACTSSGPEQDPQFRAEPVAKPVAEPVAEPIAEAEAEVEPVVRGPVQMVLGGIQHGKPPLRWYAGRLTLENHDGRPRWLVFPYDISTPLPAEPVFTVGTSPGIPFGGAGFTGEGGAVVEVRMVGEFSAFHLAAHGRVVFERYDLKAWGPVERFEVWEVAELRVDGRPLEDWLPYPTLSGADVIVGPQVKSTDLDWNRATSSGRKDYPTKPVHEVRAEVVRRWPVEIVGAAEQHAP